MDDNKYLARVEAFLEKVAQEKEGPSKLGIGVEAVAGVGLAHKSSDKLLGYHKLYHGTTKANAASIKTKGFDPSYGGTGNATAHERFVANSKGHTHFSKSKVMPELYASKIGDHFQEFVSPFGPSRKTLEQIAKNRKDGEVLTTRIPDYHYKKFAPDRDSVSSLAADDIARDVASKTTRRINPKYISGGAGSKGIGTFMNAKHMKTYLSRASGRNRFLKGLAIAGAGAAAVTHAGFQTKKIVDESKD